MDYTIKPTEGLGPLRFGMNPNEVKALLGLPDEEKIIDAATSGDTLMLTFEKAKISCFFEDNAQQLACIDVDHLDCQLGAFKIFNFGIEQTRALMGQMGYFDSEIDNFGTVEDCLAYLDASVDFYYVDGKLQNITLSR